MAHGRMKGLLALLMGMLVACFIAIPALAWDWQTAYSGGYELTPEDTSLFDGYELATNYMNENEGMIKLMWSMTGFTGSRDSTSCCEVFLAVEGSDGQQRVDLTAQQNAELANARVTLESYVGSSLDTDLEDIAVIHYDPPTNYYSKPEYTVTTREGSVDGQPATMYYFVYSGKLADVLGVYGELKQTAADDPHEYEVEDGVTHNFWAVSTTTDPHSYVSFIQEDVGNAFSPMDFMGADGNDFYRFDGTLGIKFIAPVDDGYIVDEVAYTVNGQKTVLTPTGETHMWWEDMYEHPVYQVPPIEAPVSISVSAHAAQHTVNPDGTVTFEDGYLPTASKVTFAMPDGVTFHEAAVNAWYTEFRKPYEVENAASTATNGIDYYCWPDKFSEFSFDLPDNYVLDDVTLSPSDAGIAEIIDNYGAVRVQLSKPATLTLSASKLSYDYTVIDPATHIQVSLANGDAQMVEQNGLSFYVAQVTNPTEIRTALGAVVADLQDAGDPFSADEILVFDIGFMDDEGHLYGMGAIGAFEFGAQVLIPMPVGWDASVTRVFHYYEESYGDEFYNWVYWMSNAEPVGADSALSFNAGPNLGRFVLVRESDGTHRGWSYEADGTYYYDMFGQRVSDYWLQEDDGNYYYFAKNGKLVTNDWVQAGGKWYYMDDEGKLVWTGVSYYQGKYYWVNKGNVQTSKGGWKSYKGAYYYFNGAYGAAYAKQWLKYGNAYYYFGADGKLVINGWATYGSYYFYMGANGQPVVNTWIDYGGSRYHFNASGICDQVASY